MSILYPLFDIPSHGNSFCTVNWPSTSNDPLDEATFSLFLFLNGYFPSQVYTIKLYNALVAIIIIESFPITIGSFSMTFL